MQINTCKQGQFRNVIELNPLLCWPLWEHSPLLNTRHYETKKCTFVTSTSNDLIIHFFIVIGKTIVKNGVSILASQDAVKISRDVCIFFITNDVTKYQLIWYIEKNNETYSMWVVVLFFLLFPFLFFCKWI